MLRLSLTCDQALILNNSVQPECQEMKTVSSMKSQDFESEYMLIGLEFPTIICYPTGRIFSMISLLNTCIFQKTYSLVFKNLMSSQNSDRMYNRKCTISSISIWIMFSCKTLRTFYTKNPCVILLQCCYFIQCPIRDNRKHTLFLNLQANNALS